MRTVARKCKGPVIGKFPGLVAELARSYRRIEKILVVSDADGRDPGEMERDFKARLVKSYRFEVIPIIIVEALEAWLIADPLTLKNLIGVRTAFRSPERIRDPKTQLQRLLPPTTAYTPELARRIAEGIDLDILQQRCPRFSAFRDALLNP
jgi:hypothetical protein